MRDIFVIALLASLCGCTPSPMDKAKQDFSCRNSGGVYKYTVTNSVMCRNGVAEREWGEVKITEEFYPKREVK